MITAERFIAKLRRRTATYDERVDSALVDARLRFDHRESKWRTDLLAEVVESERGPAVAMAKALGLELEMQPEQAAPVPDSEFHDPGVDEPDGGLTPAQRAFGDAIASNLGLTEVDPETMEPLPKGAQPYTPSVVAQAARRGR